MSQCEKQKLVDLTEKFIEIPHETKTYVLPCNKLSYTGDTLFVEIPYSTDIQTEKDKQHVHEGIEQLEEKYDIHIALISPQLVTAHLGEQLRNHLPSYSAIKEVKKQLFTKLGKTNPQEINLFYTATDIESDFVKRYPEITEYLHRTILTYFIISIDVETIIDSYAPKDIYSIKAIVYPTYDSSVTKKQVVSLKFEKTSHQTTAEFVENVENGMKEILSSKLLVLANQTISVNDTILNAIIADIYMNSTIENINDYEIDLAPNLFTGNYTTPYLNFNFEIIFPKSKKEKTQHIYEHSFSSSLPTLSFPKILKSVEDSIKEEKEWLDAIEENEAVSAKLTNRTEFDTSPESIKKELTTVISQQYGRFERCNLVTQEEEIKLFTEFIFETEELKDIVLLLYYNAETDNITHSLSILVKDIGNLQIKQLVVDTYFDISTVHLLEIKHILASTISELAQYLPSLLTANEVNQKGKQHDK